MKGMSPEVLVKWVGRIATTFKDTCPYCGCERHDFICSAEVRFKSNGRVAQAEMLECTGCFECYYHATSLPVPEEVRWNSRF